MLVVFAILIAGMFLGGEKYLNQLPGWYIGVPLGIIFLNMCLVYAVMSAYITMDDGDGNHAFSVLVTKNGQIIIVKKPIWQTGKQYYINTHSEFSMSIKGKFKNSTVSIPMSLSLIHNEEFDKLDLFTVLVKDQPDSYNLSLGEYMLHIFRKVNQSSQAKIDFIIGEYAQLKISDAELLNKVIEVLDFPEQLFPNVSDVEICLGQPKTSACKGTSCEK